MTHSSKDFYTKFSGSYAGYALQRKNYLDAVDRFIIENESGVSSLADVGAGIGRRGRAIADMLGAEGLVLIDNSEGMVSSMSNIYGAEAVRADIADPDFKFDDKFDAVLCLWNVLGHIATEKRLVAIENLASLLKNGGVIFLDVNNRYNVAQYGLLSVIKNIVKDAFVPKESNGDFDLSLAAQAGSLDTLVHIFNPFEIARLIRSAGLVIREKAVINYRTGKRARTVFGGQLVYKLSK